MKLETAVKYTICQQILDFLMKILLDTSREPPTPSPLCLKYNAKCISGINTPGGSSLPSHLKRMENNEDLPVLFLKY